MEAAGQEQPNPW